VGGTDQEVGKITWHPNVIKLAEESGLIFDQEGFLKEVNSNTKCNFEQ
jgi:hypothetical protein